MNDYVAKARDASRRWRAAQGLPPREDELSALPSLASLLQSEQGEGLLSDRSLASQSQRAKSEDCTLVYEVNAIEEIKEIKERKTNDSLGFLSPPAETETRPKPATTPTAALRLTYREWFALTVQEADGQSTPPAVARALHQQIVKLTDEAGVLWADALFAEELRRFRWETARCGLCGGLGHAP